MAERHPQNIAKSVTFRAYLASDGKTPATGKTIAITISKNGGAFGNPAAGALNATQIAFGFYFFSLGTGDFDTLGPLAWRGAEGTINDAGDVITVVDPHNAGFDGIPDAAAGGVNGAVINGTNTGTVTLAAITISGNVLVSGTTTLTGAVAANAGVVFTNATGDGFVCSSTGNNGNGISASGNGTADGIRAVGGATGRGLHTLGGSTSGAGFRTEGQGGASHGIHCVGVNAGNGAQYDPGASGFAENVNGTQNVNGSILIATNLQVGAVFTVIGGINVTSGLSLSGGVIINGGAQIINSSGNAVVFQSTGGNGQGLMLLGNGSGDGLESTGGVNGRGIHAIGGSSTLEGIFAAAQGSGYAGIKALGVGTYDVIAVNGLQTDVIGKVTGNSATALVGVAAQVDVQQIVTDSGAAQRLQRSADSVVLGTVGTGSTVSNIVTSSLVPLQFDQDEFIGRVVLFDRNTITAGLRGQGSPIAAGSTGANIALSDALSRAPVSGDTFTIT